LKAQKGMDYFGHIGVDGRIIFKGLKLWSWFIWHMTGPVADL
jgi:hypothetical protein